MRTDTGQALKILCSPGFQSALSPFTDFYWPDLRSEVNPLLQQQDLLRRNLQELHSLMDKLQTDILEEPFHTSEQPAVSYYLQKEGGLTLDTQGFSPEELGRKQSQQEDGEKEGGRVRLLILQTPGVHSGVRPA